MTYQPKPIDTTTITLSDELAQLTEILGENSHDHWAMARFAEGYTYGEERNDTLKYHPCLVPYHDLPESEKDWSFSSSEGAME